MNFLIVVGILGIFNPNPYQVQGQLVPPPPPVVPAPETPAPSIVNPPGRVLDVGPCETSLEITAESCAPCDRDKWQFMVANTPVGMSRTGDGVEQCHRRQFFRRDESCNDVTIITEDFVTSCFNPDPSESKEHVGIGVIVNDRVSEGEPALDPFKSAIGFQVPEVPFFRYFLPLARKKIKDYDAVDIGGVGKYFVDLKHPAKPDYDTDFELFEWPGRNAEKQGQFLEDITSRNYGCIGDEYETLESQTICVDHHNFVMLSFDRATSKFNNYPCNAIRGTHVMAYGMVVELKAEEVANDVIQRSKWDGVPAQRIYLSHGTASMHKEYVHPLYIRNVSLVELRNSNDRNLTSDHANFNRCIWDLAAPDYTDLRSVTDFTFTTERLILGMQCGVLIVKQIMDLSFVVDTSRLQTTFSLSTFFPEPLNKLSGSVCCALNDECNRETPIVAGYSFQIERRLEIERYMYISFDLGDHFERKNIAPAASLINLVQSMYRLYDRWDLYYKLLEPEPDPDIKSKKEQINKRTFKSYYSDLVNVTDARTRLFQQFRKDFKIWLTLNPEEKEEFVKLYAQGFEGQAKHEAARIILQEAFCSFVRNITTHFIINYTSPTFPRFNSSLTLWYPDTDYTPRWVRNSIAKRYEKYFPGQKSRWNHNECEKDPICREQFVEDKTVADILIEYTGDPQKNKAASNTIQCPTENTTYYWKERTMAHIPRTDPNEVYCWEIVSLRVIKDKQEILFLCKVGYCKANGTADGKPDCFKHTPKAVYGDRYGIFEAAVRPRVPIITLQRRSKRIFQCERIEVLNKPGVFVEPVFVGVPRSPSLLIVNCNNTVFFSGNLGRTLFNAMFYRKLPKTLYFKDEVTGIEYREDSFEYIRTSILKELNAPPQIAIDSNGHTVLLTFGHHYLYGIMSYNREFRMILGEIYKKRQDENSAIGRINDKISVAQPWFSNSEEPSISLTLVAVLNTMEEYQPYFKQRTALRFVNIPLSIHDDLRPFYSENLQVFPEARAQKQDFGDCSTYEYLLNPREIKLDIGDQAVIKIDVVDSNPLLAVAVFANAERGLDIEVKKSNRSAGTANEVITHNWDIFVTATQNYRNREEALVDAWFGSRYENLLQYGTSMVVVNFPTLRCHVQPSGSVATEIGCLGKTIAAHEDEYRPQCRSKFVNNFEYVLKRGQYDPELARYWLEHNREFVKRRPEDNGDLHITYDYATFGCPLEPYIDDEFAPDLRILTEDIRRNSSLGPTYNGSYILLEIFGASGYDYIVKNKETYCLSRPQSRARMLRDWIIRRRIFNVTSGRMRVMHGQDVSDGGKPLDVTSGSLIFDGSGVYEHLNIWNRVNYEHCNDSAEERDRFNSSDEDWGKNYEILNNNVVFGTSDYGRTINKIKWGKRRPQVYIFLVIALDKDESFCNHYAWFGVSLPKAEELDKMSSIICFCLFTLLWVFFIILGFYGRKAYIRKQYVDEARAERLKQAAWTVIYRYERLLHESENRRLEAEITDFHKQLREKEKERQSKLPKKKQPLKSNLRKKR